MPLSTHCAPSLHLHPALAMQNLVHLEYFYDHVRIEQLLFKSAAKAKDGHLIPDLDRPGLGLEFKLQDAKNYQINF